MLLNYHHHSLSSFPICNQGPVVSILLDHKLGCNTALNILRLMWSHYTCG